MTRFTKGQFLRYTITPQVGSRLQELFFSGFKYIPFFIALVYSTVKLLPANHPYLNPANAGRFGLRHVIAEAANHLRLSSRNSDQMILFLVVLVGIVIVMMQILLLGMVIFMRPALAAVAWPTNFADFFVTANPRQDIALMMLDLVFGVPNFFHSCVSEGYDCVDIQGNLIQRYDVAQWILQPFGYPYPIHIALHGMFRIYSIGLLVVATFITCYFMATVALETAQTGTPFGKRFNKLWAPIRLVVAFGLLIPLGTPGTGGGAGGLNTAQYIVLYAAKFGSGFATKGWEIFNGTLTETYLGDAETLVSEPNTPEVGGILQFMFVAATCRELEKNKVHPRNVKAYIIRDVTTVLPYAEFAVESTGPGAGGAGYIASYDAIMNFINGAQNIVVRFGVIDDTAKVKGQIKPICGEMVIPLTDPRLPGQAEKGPEVMQRYYVYLLQELWADVFTGYPPAGYSISGYTQNFPLNMVKRWGNEKPDETVPLPDSDYRSALRDFYRKDLTNALKDPGASGMSGVLNSANGALDDQRKSGTWAISATLKAKGWGGAGLWYNKIAELNGTVTESVDSVPSVSLWPEVMEYVKQKKRQQNQNVSISERFKPDLSNNQDIPNKELEQYAPTVYWKAFDYWQSGGFSTTSHTQPTGNIFVDAINAMFGTEGLYNMRKNADIHPLAQLTAIGKSLVETSIRNLTFAAVGGGSAAFLATFDQFLGGTAKAISSFLMTTVMITLSIGFVLYYIVPFLPFIYFFFAIGGWLKAIFEAMVGAPLWALAHIRIDGNGLPGAAAVNGYFLIFEIFLRPILIIFGLLASISIFSALVAVLNEIWDLVTSNLTGFDIVYDTDPANAATQKIGQMRHAVDEFFFTVIYAIIVYMMGMSSFKLIDLIPANILRWMGQSVATENDARENAAESLVSTSTVGSQQAVSSLGGSLKGVIDKIPTSSAGAGG